MRVVNCSKLNFSLYCFLFCHIYDEEHFHAAIEPSSDPTRQDLSYSVFCFVLFCETSACFAANGSGRIHLKRSHFLISCLRRVKAPMEMVTQAALMTKSKRKNTAFLSPFYNFNK